MSMRDAIEPDHTDASVLSEELKQALSRAPGCGLDPLGDCIVPMTFGGNQGVYISHKVAEEVIRHLDGAAN